MIRPLYRLSYLLLCLSHRINRLAERMEIAKYKGMLAEQTKKLMELQLHERLKAIHRGKTG